MTKYWYFWDTGLADGAWNMAADQYLLYSPLEYPVLRLYQWLPAALTLGYAQPLEKHVNRIQCTRSEVPVFRRMTGGKAVLHDKELTYSLSGAVHLFPFSLPLMETYNTIAQAFIKALRLLGISAEMAPKEFRSQKNSISSCFAQPSAYEILAHCRNRKCKILGSAQKRTKQSVLQHGSLLLQYFPSEWSKLLQRVREISEDRAAGIEEVLGYLPSLPAIKEAVRTGFQAEFEISFLPLSISLKDEEQIRDIARNYYPNLTLDLDSNANPV
jgi:lipoyl(octanoyl) transferase